MNAQQRRIEFRKLTRQYPIGTLVKPSMGGKLSRVYGYKVGSKYPFLARNVYESISGKERHSTGSYCAQELNKVPESKIDATNPWD